MCTSRTSSRFSLAHLIRLAGLFSSLSLSLCSVAGSCNAPCRRSNRISRDSSRSRRRTSPSERSEAHDGTRGKSKSRWRNRVLTQSLDVSLRCAVCSRKRNTSSVRSRELTRVSRSSPTNRMQSDRLAKSKFFVWTALARFFFSLLSLFHPLRSRHTRQHAQIEDKLIIQWIETEKRVRCERRAMQREETKSEQERFRERRRLRTVRRLPSEFLRAARRYAR